MSQFFKTHTEIQAWLRKYDVQAHNINNDLTVDVRGSVFLDGKNLTEIPIQFASIDGNFYCQNNQLTTLKGSPFKVNGMFQCSDNQLTSLAFSPERVGGDFRCSNNPIKNLSELKCIIYGSFECENCPISSLNEFKAKINKNFIHSWLMINLENAPPIYNELKDFYKQDLISKKLKTEINYDDFQTILEKLKLESNTHALSHSKKSVKL